MINKSSITSDRLILQPLNDDHLDTLLNIYNSETNMKYIPNAHKKWTLKELKAKYHKFETYHEYGIYAIIFKESGKIIGEAGLFDYNNNAHIVELGYIIDSEFWHIGLGTEVCQTLINHCFNEAGFTTIIARMYADNKASVKVSEKCGMLLTSTFTDSNGKQGLEYRSVKPAI
ncbi:GNAT family N-acetyltransferase [Carboxylicivirga caseinilyticus]|uniref:GNAT family N-acetyltransferase n=1 Tax=Carboxylicivirga caseinilyticus TaxID=3417572 RepID=UPI003D329C1C|nr:GNAT family N-acetyltransferase [Marinilabiliaceae bacterium A049]